METLTVETAVSVPQAKAWEYWTDETHITKWNMASPDWECPKAENHVESGGRFKFLMQAKDGSSSFEFKGQYAIVIPMSLLSYTIDDGRSVTVHFEPIDASKTKIIEHFEAEKVHSLAEQKSGWSAILENFKKYVESH